jgi:hypothetical protein
MRAMKEVGANPEKLLCFLQDYETAKLPNGIREFVAFNLDIAMNGTVEQVAGAFLFGREKVIPEMFQGILEDIQKSKINCPTLIYYLERHIEVDGGEHSHLALACLEAVCGNDEKKWQDAINVGVKSLQLREKLWDSVKNNIQFLH